MPSDARAAGKIVFVGNIPYGKLHDPFLFLPRLTPPGLTEEQIAEIFSSAGRVISFRLVYDRETGRPKGFGFAEYSDAETAASAVRNLDNYEIMGRKLRVDFSHEGNAPDDVDTASYSQQPQQNQATLPSGTDMPEGISAPDAISNTLKALPVPQLLEILQQMKTLVNQDPVKATDLLRQAPQLSYAIFQALLLMNLVDTTVLTQVIETSGGTAPPPQPVQQQPPVQQQQPPQQYYQPPAATPTPPVPAPAVDPQRAQLMQSVLHLTPEQIASFPPEQQQQILFLKQQYMAGGAI